MLWLCSDVNAIYVWAHQQYLPSNELRLHLNLTTRENFRSSILIFVRIEPHATLYSTNFHHSFKADYSPIIHGKTILNLWRYTFYILTNYATNLSNLNLRYNSKIDPHIKTQKILTGPSCNNYLLKQFWHASFLIGFVWVVWVVAQLKICSVCSRW